ncbi:LSU ribosomal protein L29P [Mariprofundus ferrinatatus]|uniref:Large ribosomal subunit protein uL29 n=1 Tax=Mariprofundus ferrinatatus TaxID=1921087 RepID=A0A2K8LER6_9PROT|nr:50S ribosomal protein L29 [Mariprofundus ferrinatatus]ATX82766.1 LSU ribosomal protein L29P [Mariprofundus ferrinatatus]
MSDNKKAKDLRGMKDAELKERMDELAAENMKLRFQKATMQLNNTARVGQVRREIARIKTILAERG